jgi:hypothetical protein
MLANVRITLGMFRLLRTRHAADQAGVRWSGSDGPDRPPEIALAGRDPGQGHLSVRAILSDPCMAPDQTCSSTIVPACTSLLA